MISLSNIITIEDQLKKFSTKLEKKEYLLNRVNFYKSSPEGCIAYIEECVRIPYVGKGLVPFELYDAQKRYIETVVNTLFDPHKEIFVGAGSRQCGKTTTLMATCSWLQTFFSDYPIVLLHVDDTRGAKTCGDYRTMCENRPGFMQPPRIKNALTHQIWKNGSSFMLQPTQKTSKKGSSDTGRSLRVATLWIDEGAFIDLDKLEESILPTTSATFPMCAKAGIPFGIILTSSANGRDGIGRKFYYYWTKAHSENPGIINGCKLYWKDIPLFADDPKWFENQREKAEYNERKINQEYEIVFYGAESSFFTDTQLADMYKYQKVLMESPLSIPFADETGAMYVLKIFSEIRDSARLIMGVDVCKSLGQDFNTIVIIDYDTGEQVAEFADNKISPSAFGKLIDKIIKYLYLKYDAVTLLSIEFNIGFALISQLRNEIDSEIYNILICRDTISKDNFDRLPNQKMIPYSECKYGIDTTRKTRPLMINEIYKKATREINCIKSQALLSEILSLQQNKDGKVEGMPHDDLIFSAALCWVLMSHGRSNEINNSFLAGSDILSYKNKDFTLPNSVRESRKIKTQSSEIDYLSLVDEIPKHLQEAPKIITPKDSEFKIQQLSNEQEYRLLVSKMERLEHTLKGIGEIDSMTYSGGAVSDDELYGEII